VLEETQDHEEIIEQVAALDIEQSSRPVDEDL
jgi:hypothetical protein